MPEELLRQEFAMLAKRTAALDIAAYLVSVICIGATMRFALGLLLGTAVLFGTLLLLQYSVRRAAEDAKRSGVTNQRRYLLLYGARLLLFAVAFGAALLLRTYLSPVAVALPMCYPRLIYTAGAVLSQFTSRNKRGEN